MFPYCLGTSAEKQNTSKKHELKHHTEWKDADHIVHCYNTKSTCTLLSTVQPAFYLHKIKYNKERSNVTYN